MPAKSRSSFAFKISALLTLSILFSSVTFAQTVYNFQGIPGRLLARWATGKGRCGQFLRHNRFWRRVWFWIDLRTDG